MNPVRTALVSLLAALDCPCQTLVKDINSASNGPNPSSAPSAGVALSIPSFTGFIFSADDARHGRELWRSDATGGGTAMVTDLRPGPSGSAPQNLTVFGNYVYFSAEDGVRGRELWRSDGTAAGTTLVADIVSGAQGSDPVSFAATSTRLYFSAATPAYGRELWSTTGSNASLIVDLNPGPNSGYVNGLVAVTSGLERIAYFGEDKLKGLEPVVCFGTTTTVYDLQPLGSSSPQQLVTQGGDFFLVATAAPAGTQVWRLDLSVQKAYVVSAVPQGVATRIDSLTAGASQLCFASYPQFTAPLTVYRCNGTNSTQISTYSAANGAAAGIFHGEFNGFFYYSVVLYQVLPVTETYAVHMGTAITTKLGQNPTSRMIQAGSSNQPVFIAPATVGVQFALWTASGTVTTEIKIIPLSLPITPPTLLGSTKYHTFLSVSDSMIGTEPWVSNFTNAGTGLLKDLALPPTASAFPGHMVRFRKSLYFVANDGVRGEELWRSDGTEAGTTLVKDINPIGTNGSAPRSLHVFQDVLYFNASDGVNGSELWRSDGTNAGTSLVKDIYPGFNHSSPSSFFEINQKLFFTADDGVHGRELWSTDGTNSGTALFHDLVPGTWSGAGGSYFDVASTGAFAYFVGNDPAYGEEPWITDGTIAGTRLIKDIFSGTGTSVRTRLTLSGSNVYFAARDLFYGYELWRSDGSAGGTYMVKDINPNSADGNPSDILAGYYQGVYFAATNPTTGTELWRSDGTPAGTYQVSDTAPGPTSSFARPLVVTMEGVRETLFFSASNPTQAIYSATPQGAGTIALKSLTVNAARQAGMGRLIVFAGADSASGSELWVADASVTGTTLVAELEPGAVGSLPSDFTPVGSSLFFSASSSVTGRELYVLPMRNIGAALFETFGVGCGNTGGKTPVLGIGSTRPSLREGSITLNVTNARASSAAAMLYSPQSIDTPLGLGCHLYVPLGASSFAFTTAANGSGLFPITLPNASWLVGDESYWQAAILDPTGRFLNLVTISDAGKVTVGK